MLFRSLYKYWQWSKRTDTDTVPYRPPGLRLREEPICLQLPL